jgi:hypothetical protein
MKPTHLSCALLLGFFPAIAFAQSPVTADAYISNASSSAALANYATAPSLVVLASAPNASLHGSPFIVIASCRCFRRAKTELVGRNGKAAERTPRPPMGKILPCADISTAVPGNASPILSAQKGAIKHGSVQETT